MSGRAKSLLYTIFFLLCAGCAGSGSGDGKLADYFKSDHVREEVSGRTYVVEVEESRLVKNWQQRKADKWQTAEAFASLAAVKTMEGLSREHAIDSIEIRIHVDTALEVYRYGVASLKHVKGYTETAGRFVQTLTQQSYSEARSFLSDNILKSTPDTQLEEMFRKAFPREKISRIELVALKEGEGDMSIYLDVYYPNGPQTYIFAFTIGNPEIQGISIP